MFWYNDINYPFQQILFNRFILNGQIIDSKLIILTSLIQEHVCLFSFDLRSGIIKQDPELPPDKLLNLPPPRPKNAIFEDKEKSKVRPSFLDYEDYEMINK